MNSTNTRQHTLRTAVIDCGSKKIDTLFTILRDHCRYVSHITLDDALGYNFTQTEAVIISGGPHLFTDPEKGEILRRKFQFISRLKVPILGICLGHQAIGLHFGAEVYRDKENRGPVTLELLTEHKLMAGIPDAAIFAADHCEGITLPRNFKRLACSRDYYVEAMACKTRPVFGVQFHPEISDAPGRRLIENFLEVALDNGGAS